MARRRTEGRKKASARKRPSIAAVDLFCGAGGLTRGLKDAGVDVRLGVDVDGACEYPFRKNNRAKFLAQPVEEITRTHVLEATHGAQYRLLAGCAPCQPFSRYRQGRDAKSDDRWGLLRHFTRLVRSSRPELVTMENVPGLAKEKVFREFVRDLRAMHYHVHHQIVDCADYGVPQSRERLVLLASTLGEISLIEPTTPGEEALTVRDVLKGLPVLRAGGVNADDPLHSACALSPTNLARIKASVPGGTWRDWDEHLVAKCHKKKSGKTYPSVYGRMSWDEPAPTMTTQYFGFGNGRFGHPSQARAISLREGAILQSFPEDYEFVEPGGPISRKELGRLIGNAVPVRLGEAIGKSFVAHVRAHERAAA